MDQEQRASLLRLRAAVDVLLQDDFGHGRGHELDQAVDQVATAWGRTSCLEARADRLHVYLEAVCKTLDDGEIIRLARKELDHDRKTFGEPDPSHLMVVPNVIMRARM